LNLGVELSKGDIFVALSGDAVPANKYWLENLINFLKKDKTLAGVYSRQIPYPDCNPIEAYKITTIFPKTSFTISHFRENIIFSNTSAAIPKKLLIKYPFKLLAYGEDKEWALRMLKRGYKIGYASDSIVYHSHNYGLEKRFFLFVKGGKGYYQTFKKRVSLINLLKALLTIIGNFIKGNYFRILHQRGIKGIPLIKWSVYWLFFDSTKYLGFFVGTHLIKNQSDT
jgi:rhamnosyltransferase